MATFDEQVAERQFLRRRKPQVAGLEAPAEGTPNDAVPVDATTQPVGPRVEMPQTATQSVGKGGVFQTDPEGPDASRWIGGGGGVQTAGADSDYVKDSYKDIIEKGKQPVDRNDVNIRAQSDAYSAQMERARRNALGDMAEASGPYATGAIRGETRMGAERSGQAAGAFEAQVIAREVQSRREEVLAALNGLYGAISDEDRNNLQRDLASLNAQLQQAQLAQQQSQFEDTLGFNVADREAYWNWQASQQQGGY